MRRAVLLFAVLALAGGCASNASVAPDVNESTTIARGEDGRSLDALRHGRKLFVSKCGGCHPLHPAGSLSDSEWAAALDEKEMARKARLTAADRDAVLAYVHAVNGRE